LNSRTALVEKFTQLTNPSLALTLTSVRVNTEKMGKDAKDG